MRRVLVVCGLVLVAGIAAPTPPSVLASSGSADWNQWGGNGGETWSNDAETTISASNAAALHLVWSHQFHFKEVLWPAVVGGSVYTAICCHRDYCQSERVVGIPIDPTGVAWKYGDEYTNVGAPSVGRGVVVVFDSGCSVSDPRGYVALHAADGTYTWGSADWWSSNVLNRGREYIASGYGVNGNDPSTLTARDQRSGAVDWIYGPLPSDHALFRSRAAGDAVYVEEGGDPSSITALSAADGSFRWNVPDMVPFAASRSVVYGSIQNGPWSPSNGIVALDPSDGSTLWARTDLGPSPLAAFSSIVDVSNTPDGGLVAFDPNDGSTIWTLHGSGFGQPTIANGVVFVWSADAGAILVLDGSTGSQLTTIPTGRYAVVANGWVFTASDHLLSAYAP